MVSVVALMLYYGTIHMGTVLVLWRKDKKRDTKILKAN